MHFNSKVQQEKQNKKNTIKVSLLHFKLKSFLYKLNHITKYRHYENYMKYNI